MKASSKINSNLRNGFSLVELAITMLILSLLLGGYFKYNEVSTSAKAEQDTNFRMEVIEKAIMSFYNQNGFLPCPALLNDSGSTVGQGTDCTVDLGVGSGALDFGSGVNRTRTGAIPFQNLNIPSEYLTDGWGNRFMYTVIRDLAKTATLYNNYAPSPSVNNVILIQDQNSASTYYNSEVTAYALVSVGGDAKGGYSKNGALIRSCSGASVYNCDGDEVFMYNFRDLTTSNVSNDFVKFDDFITWKTYKQVKNEGDFNGSGRGYSMRFMLLGGFYASGVNVGSFATFTQIAFPTVLWNSAKNVSFDSGTSTIILTGPGTFTIKTSIVACSVGTFNSFHYDTLSGASRGGTTEYSGAVAANTSCAPSFAEHTVTLGATTEQFVVYLQAGPGNGVDGAGRSVNVSPGNYFAYAEVWEETR